MTHADALVAGFTFKNGWLNVRNNDGSGGGVYIDANGGTVSNCVIRNHRADTTHAGSAAYLTGENALITHCIVTNNYGGSNDRRCDALCLEAGARGENSLIAGNTSTRDTEPGGVDLISSTLVNCTVADSVGTRAGGVVLFKTAKGGTLPQVVNCAFYNNRTLATDVTEKPYKNVYASILNYRSNTGDNGITDAEAAAAFANCASKETLNGTCLATDAPLFVDAANGDYRLTAESPLVNAGYDTSSVAGVGLYDLLGSPRFVKRVDIGCFEYREPKLDRTGLMLLVR